MTRSRAQTAVHHQETASREARSRRGEEEHRARKLFGADMAMQRNDLVEKRSTVAADRCAEPFFHVQLEVVIDRSGMQRVNPNIARSRLFGQNPHQADLRVL